MNNLDKAICFAVNAFAGKTRKVRNVPAILHSLEVATITSTMTDDIDVYIAAILHDVLEDTHTNQETLTEEFGEKVVRLVLSDTEDKEVKSWQIRKETTISVLKNTDDINELILVLSDKLSNIRSIYNDMQFFKGDFWRNFHQSDPKKQYWYYSEIALATSKLSVFPAYQEYVSLIDKVFLKDKGENSV